MAASIKFNSGVPSANGPAHLLVIDVTGPASYAAGGFSVNAAALGLSTVDQVGVLSCSGGLLAQYVKSTEKVKLVFPTGGDDTAPTDPTADPVVVGAVSDLTVDLTAGSGTPDSAAIHDGAVANVVTPGVGKEIAATADCSSVTVSLLVLGRV